MNRPLAALFAACCLLFSSMPGSAYGACDPEELFNDAFVMIRSGSRAGPVAEILEEALDCPGGEQNYLVNFSLAVAKLRLGQVEEARVFADQARLLSSGSDAESATHLLSLMDSELTLVQFRLQVDPEARVALRLVDSLGISAEAESVKALVPRQMSRFVETIWEDVFLAAQQAAQKGRHPLDVWLPAGRYTLNTGQTVDVKGGGIQLILVEKVYDWSDRSLRVGGAYMAVVPFAPQSAGIAHNGLLGFQVQASQRLSSRLLARAALGIFPGALYDTSVLAPTYSPTEAESNCLGGFTDLSGPDNGEVAALSADDLYCGTPSQAYTLSVGLGWPVEIKRRMHLLLGVDLQATGLKSVTSPDGTSADNPLGFYAANWGGILPTLGLELFRQIGAEGGLDSGAFLGISAGGAPMGILNNTIEGREEAPIELTFSARWIATMMAQTGIHVRF